MSFPMRGRGTLAVKFKYETRCLVSNNGKTVSFSEYLVKYSFSPYFNYFIQWLVMNKAQKIKLLNQIETSFITTQ
jgi:hypothetical protein